MAKSNIIFEPVVNSIETAYIRITGDGATVSELLDYANFTTTTNISGSNITDRAAVGSIGYIHAGSLLYENISGTINYLYSQNPLFGSIKTGNPENPLLHTANLGGYDEVILFLSRGILIEPGATFYIDMNCTLYFNTTYNVTDYFEGIPRAFYRTNPIRAYEETDGGGIYNNNGLIGFDYFKCLGNIVIGEDPNKIDYPTTTTTVAGKYGFDLANNRTKPRLKLVRPDGSNLVSYRGDYPNSVHPTASAGRTSHSMFAISDDTTLAAGIINSDVDMSGCDIVTAYTIGSGGRTRNIDTADYTANTQSTIKFNSSVVRFGLNGNSAATIAVTTPEDIRKRRDARRTQFQVRHGNWELDNYTQYGGSLALSIPPTKAKGIKLVDSVIECQCEFPTNIVLENLKLETTELPLPMESGIVYDLTFVIEEINGKHFIVVNKIPSTVSEGFDFNDELIRGSVINFGVGSDVNTRYTIVDFFINGNGFSTFRAENTAGDELAEEDALLSRTTNVGTSLTYKQTRISKSHEGNSHITFGANTSSLILRNFDLTHPEHRSVLNNAPINIDDIVYPEIVAFDAGIDDVYPADTQNGLDTGYHRGTIALNKELKFKVYDDELTGRKRSNTSGMYINLFDSNDDAKFIGESSTENSNFPERLPNNTGWSGNSIIHNWTDQKAYSANSGTDGIAIIKLDEIPFDYSTSAHTDITGATDSANLPTEVKSAVDGLFTHVMTFPPHPTSLTALDTAVNIQFEKRTPFVGTARKFGYIEKDIYIDEELIIDSKDDSLTIPIVAEVDPQIPVNFGYGSANTQNLRKPNSIETLRELYQAIKIEEWKLYLDNPLDPIIRTIENLVTTDDNEIKFPANSVLNFIVVADPSVGIDDVVSITEDSNANNIYTFKLPDAITRYIGAPGGANRVGTETPLDDIDTIVIPGGIVNPVEEVVIPFAPLLTLTHSSVVTDELLVNQDPFIERFDNIVKLGDRIEFLGDSSTMDSINILRIKKVSLDGQTLILENEDVGSTVRDVEIAESVILYRRLSTSDNANLSFGGTEIDTGKINVHVNNQQILPKSAGGVETVSIVSNNSDYNIKVFLNSTSAVSSIYSSKTRGFPTTIITAINNTLNIYAWRSGGYDPIYLEHVVSNTFDNIQTINLDSYFAISENKSVLRNKLITNNFSSLESDDLSVFTSLYSEEKISFNDANTLENIGIPYTISTVDDFTIELGGYTSSDPSGPNNLDIEGSATSSELVRIHIANDPVSGDPIIKEYFAKSDSSNVDKGGPLINLYSSRNFIPENLVNTNIITTSVREVTRLRRPETFSIDFQSSKTYAANTNLAEAFNLVLGTEEYFDAVETIARKPGEGTPDIKLIDIIRIGEGYGILIDDKLNTIEGPNFNIRNTVSPNSLVVLPAFIETTPTEFDIRTVLNNEENKSTIIFRTDAPGIDIDILSSIIETNVTNIVKNVVQNIADTQIKPDVQTIVDDHRDKISLTVTQNGTYIP